MTKEMNESHLNPQIRSTGWILCHRRLPASLSTLTGGVAWVQLIRSLVIPRIRLLLIDCLSISCLALSTTVQF